MGEVISAWTGIPVGKMMKDEISTVLSLPTFLGQRVIGQIHALEIISQRISTSRARLDDPNKPVGVFMLVGPSGVGKTETALALVRPSLWRRTESDHDQHVGVSGGAYRVDAEGLASGICGLRRRRSADGGGAAAAVFGGAAG